MTGPSEHRSLDTFLSTVTKPKGRLTVWGLDRDGLTTTFACPLSPDELARIAYDRDAHDLLGFVERIASGAGGPPSWPVREAQAFLKARTARLSGVAA